MYKTPTGVACWCLIPEAVYKDLWQGILTLWAERPVGVGKKGCYTLPPVYSVSIPTWKSGIYSLSQVFQPLSQFHCYVEFWDKSHRSTPLASGKVNIPIPYNMCDVHSVSPALYSALCWSHWGSPPEVSSVQNRDSSLVHLTRGNPPLWASQLTLWLG